MIEFSDNTLKELLQAIQTTELYKNSSCSKELKKSTKEMLKEIDKKETKIKLNNF